jgi:hypothetical protein
MVLSAVGAIIIANSLVKAIWKTKAHPYLLIETQERHAVVHGKMQSATRNPCSASTKEISMLLSVIARCFAFPHLSSTRGNAVTA